MSLANLFSPFWGNEVIKMYINFFKTVAIVTFAITFILKNYMWSRTIQQRRSPGWLLRGSIAGNVTSHAELWSRVNLRASACRLSCQFVEFNFSSSRWSHQLCLRSGLVQSVLLAASRVVVKDGCSRRNSLFRINKSSILPSFIGFN